MKMCNLANVQTCSMNVLDIFILIFLEELSKVTKQGIKASYVLCEGNLPVYKGKLLVNKHISKNIICKDKFYMNYDEFSPNIPGNRIIKTTLLFIKNQTSNRNIIRNQYLLYFQQVDVSVNCEKDFSKCVNNRLMCHYDSLIKWCKVFLNNKSFTNYREEDNSYSLLFPMKRIFESYITKSIKKSHYFKDFSIYAQHNKYCLLESHKKFRLKPDILLESKNKTIIMDTKWKILNDESTGNYGISQWDLYQMYAYSKKYNSDKVILIYPKFNNEVVNKNFYSEKENGIMIFLLIWKIWKRALGNLEKGFYRVKKIYGSIYISCGDCREDSTQIG